MSSLEMILILVLFLNFASDSHSLQETSPSPALHSQQSTVPSVTSCSCSSTTLDAKNVTDFKIPEAPVLSSIEEFCSAKVMDSIGLVYHVGSHLLLSVTQEPNGSVSANQTNDTVKQWFYVYNWKTGELYHKVVQLDEIFVMPDDQKPHGTLVFATTVCVSTETSTQESQLVMATFSTPNSSMESHTCLDMTYSSLTPNPFLSTRMFRLEESSEDVFVPKLSLQPIELEQIQLRGRIGFGGGILIREELACPRMGFSGNSTAVQYASGFTISDRLILQTKPGFVQIGPNGKEMPISKMLNCRPFLGSNFSAVFPNELNLITEGQGFSFFGLLDTIYDAILNNLDIFISIAGAAIGLWIFWLIVPILEELLDDYTDKDHQPAREIHPEQIHYV